MPPLAPLKSSSARTPTGYGSMPSSSRRCRFSRRTRSCSGRSSPSLTAGFVGLVTAEEPTCRRRTGRPMSPPTAGSRVSARAVRSAGVTMVEWRRVQRDRGNLGRAVRQTAPLATSFDLQAAEYARLRPGYPAAAGSPRVPDDAPGGARPGRRNRQADRRSAGPGLGSSCRRTASGHARRTAPAIPGGRCDLRGRRDTSRWPMPPSTRSWSVRRFTGSTPIVR